MNFIACRVGASGNLQMLSLEDIIVCSWLRFLWPNFSSVAFFVFFSLAIQRGSESYAPVGSDKK